MDRELIPHILRLLQGPEEPSRNRDFDLFEDTVDGRALRYYKLLRSLEEEMAAAGSRGVRVSRSSDGQIEIRLENPVLRYTRSCFLPSELFACLSERLSRRGCRLNAALL